MLFFSSDYVSFVCEEMVTLRVMLFFSSDYVSFLCYGKGSLGGLCCSFVQIMSTYCPLSKWGKGHIDGYVVLLGLLLLFSCLQIDEDSHSRS